MKKKLEYGFTLIELLVVTLIMLFLSVIAISAFINKKERAEAEEAARNGGAVPVPEPVSAAETAANAAENAAVMQTLGIIVLSLIGIIALGFAIYQIFSIVSNSKRNIALRTQREANLVAAWVAVETKHENLENKVLEADKDWDTFFNMPALSDPSYAETYAMRKALVEARNAKKDRPTDISDEKKLLEQAYPLAVADLEQAFEKAQAKARQVGQHGLAREERKKIKETRNLLNIAEGTIHEAKKVAIYGQVLNALESLNGVVVPAALVKELEQRQTKSIEIQEAMAQSFAPSWGSSGASGEVSDAEVDGVHDEPVSVEANSTPVSMGKSSQDSIMSIGQGNDLDQWSIPKSVG